MTHLPSELLDLLAPHCQSEPERRALMLEVIDDKFSLYHQIDFSGSAHTFALNMLNRIRHERSVCDALIDALKRRYGTDKAQRLEALRPRLYQWAERSASILILATPDDALAERLSAELPTHGFDLLRPDQLSFADRVIAIDQADTSLARAYCRPIIHLWHRADSPPHANALDFRTAADLQPLIAALRKPTERLGRVIGGRGLPNYYIRREAPITEVVRNLTDERTNIAAICAVQGMPGVGKSVLAEAVLYDCAVRRAFPDGLIYLNVSDRNYAFAQRELARELDLPRDDFTDDLESNRRQLVKFIQERRLRLLILLDNVRDAKAIEAFQNLPNCKVLFTTRKEAIARSLQAALTALGVLSDAEGAQLILKYTGFAPDQRVDDLNVQTVATRLSRTLRGHPLAISLAASRWLLKGVAAGKELLKEYAVLLQDLPAGDPLDVFAPDEDLDQELGEASEALKPNIKRVFERSYEDLNDDNKRRFRELGIFAVESQFDAQAAAAIWLDSDPKTAQSKLETFARLALLSQNRGWALQAAQSAARLRL